MPRCFFVVFLFGLTIGRAMADEPHAPGAVQFHRDVRPILSNHCFKCHGPDGDAREAELRLDTRNGLFGESSSGAMIVAPGESASSELYRRITTDHADERMPPDEINKPLSRQQVETLARWINEGAYWKDHWAYLPPQRTEPPKSANASWPRGAIDQFVLNRLEREGLSPSPPADPITLIRRLSFDLTGFPPSETDLDAFANDPSDERYAALVDRLLASPHFGERMAMYWLDLVRYADSCGYHSDVDQPIWPYRDYVIQAFNDNLPFDRFTREQLAGDLLPDPTVAQRIATGFNRLNKTTEEGGAQEGEYLIKSAADRVRTTAGVWMAATLGCAECHDHKYDPFSTRDFYSFAAFFADVKDQGVYKAGNHDPVLLLPSSEQTEQQLALRAKISDLETALAAIPPEQEAQRKPIQDELAEVKKAQSQLENSIARTMITEVGSPREVRVLPRGNWLDRSGEIVQPALPAFLVPSSGGSRLTRLDLADWLVSSDNPLTARVFVNRLWKLSFGAGLSKSLDDFGAQGDLPSHPELLDWLAVEFRESGWNVKHVIRLLVTSAAYRQSSLATAALAERDPQNRLFGRQSQWRLEAEMIRDQALAAGGLLVPTIGGPSVKPYQPEDYWEFLNFPKRDWKDDSGDKQHRRGLYTHWQRTFLHPSLLAFDAPSREECTAERAVSNTPKAALALLNDPSFVEAAKGLAARAVARSGSDADRIAWIWRVCTSRLPDAIESEALLSLLANNRSHYTADPQAAVELGSVGQFRWPDDVPITELAAWTSVARATLNLHECTARN